MMSLTLLAIIARKKVPLVTKSNPPPPADNAEFGDVDRKTIFSVGDIMEQASPE